MRSLCLKPATQRRSACVRGRAALRVVVRPMATYSSQDPPYQPVSTAGGVPIYSTTGRSRVLQLLGEGCGTYNAEPLEAAVKQLITENPTPAPGTMSVALGQGTWQVFYAPHIANMSSAMGTRFEPIQYRLSGSFLVSNVKFSNPLLGDGWLSAGGTMARKYDDAVEVMFDRFWVDLGAGNLRADLPPDAATSLLSPDGVTGFLGRAAFFPQLAVFPVMYLDNDLAVFKFTPLDSLIAVHKVAE